MNPSHAIQTLWKYAAASVPPSELAHLACADESTNALRDLAQVTRMLGLLASADHTKATPDAEGWSGVLFGIASAIATQAELLAVASDASALLLQQDRS